MRFDLFYPIRLYPVLDTLLLKRQKIAILGAAEALLEAGVKILQFRHKDFFSRETFEEAGKVAEACRMAGAVFVMNDRADLARLLGAALHVGQEDLSPKDARIVLGGAAVLGLSTHNEEQLRGAAPQPVDYLAIGPIFGTSTKENPDPVVGVGELRRLRALTEKPLVAIGGITRSNARSVLDAGADTVAIVSDLIPPDGDLRARAAEWVKLCSAG
jgi:thiamine-phosphate pyrophosphorylase